MRKLEVISNSSLTAFRRCPREWEHNYVRRRVPATKSHALEFGSLCHLSLNEWWRRDHLEIGDRLVNALARTPEPTVSPFEVQRVNAMVTGYAARWGEGNLTTVDVELKFQIPGPCGTSFVGAFDCLAQGPDGYVVVEHKTTTADITPGSNYWPAISALDTQVSAYLYASECLGMPAIHVLYDVLRKPAAQPLLATPEHDRKYTIPTAKSPKPTLYKNQREADETPEEFYLRAFDEISRNEHRYFARKPIVRSESDMDEFREDVAHTVCAINSCLQLGRFPRHPSACSRFNSLCAYMDVCSGCDTLDSDRFKDKGGL